MGLLYYTLLFDILKQAVAMAILLYAFDAIIEMKPIKFVILVLLASVIHFPAIVFFPAFWIGQMKIGRGYLIFLVILLLITYLLRDQLLNLMLDAYGEGDIEATMAGIKFLRNKVVIMIIIVLFAILIRPPKPENSVYNSLLMFMGIAIVLQTFCGYNNVFERLADYYFHTATVFIPLIFERDNEYEAHSVSSIYDLMRQSAVLLICAFSIWRFLSYVNNSGLFLPYRFFWQQ